MPVSSFHRPLRSLIAGRACFRALCGVVLALAAVLAVSLPAIGQEPDVVQEPQQETVQTQQPAPVPVTAEEARAADEAAPATVTESHRTAPPAEAQPGQEPARPTDAIVPVEGVTEPMEPAEPAPSFLDDPAGAMSHLMRQAERDATLPHDLSPWGMFLMADWVVKGVMILLVVASLGVWTVWAAKTVEMACARARARRAASVIASSATLADALQKLAGRGGPAAFMVRSAEDELKRSAPALDHAGGGGVKERLGARLARIEAQAGRRLSRGTGMLAIVGSTAPFIGLFGTVWGIMNSFIGISQANTTNLAVVAPGIAEALLATAIGLVAAIPAVIVYNLFARSITGYAELLADAASGVEQLVSLDLDLGKVPVRTKSLALKPDSKPVPTQHAADTAEAANSPQTAVSAAE